MHPALVIACSCQEVLQEICKMSSLCNRRESWKNCVQVQSFRFLSLLLDRLDRMCEA